MILRSNHRIVQQQALRWGILIELLLLLLIYLVLQDCLRALNVWLSCSGVLGCIAGYFLVKYGIKLRPIRRLTPPNA